MAWPHPSNAYLLHNQRCERLQKRDVCKCNSMGKLVAKSGFWRLSIRRGPTTANNQNVVRKEREKEDVNRAAVQRTTHSNEIFTRCIHCLPRQMKPSVVLAMTMMTAIILLLTMMKVVAMGMKINLTKWL